MREQGEHAKQMAKKARDSALLCRDKAAQEEWFMVARLWEEIAREYDDLDGLRARSNGVRLPD